MGLMDKPILVGMPLPADYKADARIVCTVEKWGEDDNTEVYYSVTPFPTLGRDKIVDYAKYRVPSPTHILFVDSDVLPKHNTLQRLLSHDKDIVTGVYPMMTRQGFAWSVTREKDFAIGVDQLPKNLFKVNYCGFGIVLIKFEVFEAIQWPYWKNVFRPGSIEKGEDIYFCEKAKKAGFDIWCDPMVKCNHIRMANYLNIVRNLK
jgi:hypothetical protein